MTNKLLNKEKELLLQIADGDEQAFASLFSHYYEELTPFLRRYTDSWADTKEVLQQTFIRVWLSRDKLPDIHHFHAWIFKVASREYLRYVKQKVRHSRHTTIPDGSESTVFSGFFTPQEQMQTGELRKLIQEAVESLPAQRKLIFRLSREEGMKISEIAGHLSVSPNTVKNALTTALRQVREFLAERGYTISLVYLLLLTL